ncbi:STAS domain-containing protein [bacterium]|nr:STAS domain-containing protein [bacterium]
MDAVQVFSTTEEIETQQNRIPRAGLRYVTLKSGIGCIYLSGRLDILNVQQIESKFAVLTATQRKSVIVDLSNVELLSSIGLGMLISNANSLYGHCKRMVVLNPTPRVEKVIRIACLDVILPIAHDMHESLELIMHCEAA